MSLQIDLVRLHCHPKTEKDIFEVRLESKLEALPFKLDRWEQKEETFIGWFKNSKLSIQSKFADLHMLPTDKTTLIIKKEIEELLTISKILLPQGKLISVLVSGFYKPKKEPSLLLDYFLNKNELSEFGRKLSASNTAFSGMKVSGIEFSNFGPPFCSAEDRPCNKEGYLFISTKSDKFMFMSACLDLTLLEDFFTKLEGVDV